MPFNPKKIYKQALEVAEKHKLLFVDDVIAMVDCGRSRLYDFFPDGSDELDAIKEVLTKNKVQIKSSLRSKWYKSEQPTLQLALYKLSATQEELQQLQMQHIDHTTKGEKITPSKQVYKMADGTEIVFD